MGKLNTDKAETSEPMLYQGSPLNHPLANDLEVEVGRLHRLTVWWRWSGVLLLWLTVAPFSVWGLRDSIGLWMEHFTWAAVRAGFRYNLLATAGLSLCVGCTFAVLLWQSRNILFGLPERERTRLVAHVIRIREQGSSHPLWKRVCQVAKQSKT